MSRIVARALRACISLAVLAVLATFPSIVSAQPAACNQTPKATILVATGAFVSPVNVSPYVVVSDPCPGTHTGTWTFADNWQGVTSTVAATDDYNLALPPTRFLSGGFPGTPYTPVPIDYTISFSWCNDQTTLCGDASEAFIVNPRPTNDPPVAVLSVSPASGPAPLLVTADTSASYDPGSFEGIAGPPPVVSRDFNDPNMSPNWDYIANRALGPNQHLYCKPGVYTVSATARDNEGGVSTPATQQIRVLETTNPLIITTNSLPNARKDSYYAAPIQTAGGLPTHQYVGYDYHDNGAYYDLSLVDGALPPGMYLESWALAPFSTNGNLVGGVGGTPTAYGSYTFTVQSTDACGNTSPPRTLTVNVPVPPLQVQYGPSSASVGVPYHGRLAGVGGVGPYSFSLPVSALPAGLTFDSTTGQISGTPTQVQAATPFTATVTDSRGVTATRSVMLAVTCPADACRGLTPGQSASLPLPQGGSIDFSPTFASATGARRVYYSAGLAPQCDELGCSSIPLGRLRSAGQTFTLEIRDDAGRLLTQFNEPYTITLKFRDSDVPGGTTKGQLNLYYWNPTTQAWTAVLPCAGCSLDTVANTLTARLSHMTGFGLLADPLVLPPPPPVDPTGGATTPPGAGATPELDSLLLFGSGLSGVGAYAVIRLRTRRRIHHCM